ncbi:MAG: tryptophan--tRNA ligase [Deltaproteobacteria bacterium]|nr:tryptophan--tRNA ligase [Deltaproteobacteria bacterium]
MVSTRRVLSGSRPTGRQHLGNLNGAIKNWINVQQQGAECFFFSADWHALTTAYENTENVRGDELQMFVDWIACGVDPETCTLFVQSAVKQHAELYLLLAMITPNGWLERVPTYKEQQQNITNTDLNTYGFLGYPLLQTADIIIYKANTVPVGLDQVPHLEFSREVVRRFNHLYGDVFPEPEALLMPVAKVLGTDGRKMSKSYGNDIAVGEAGESLKKKIMGMVTDPARKRRQDPGNPDICGIYMLHQLYSSQDTIDLVNRECRTAGIGCVDCKKMLLEKLDPAQQAIHDKREALLKNLDFVRGKVEAGNNKAREVAERTMAQVRQAMKL